MKLRIAAVAGALGMTVAGVAVPVPALADVPCSITSMSPSGVVVGLTPRTVTFDLVTAGCTLEYWSLDAGDFYVYTDAPQDTFDPYVNDQAGPRGVIATAYNSDAVERQRVFPDGFTLKRRTTWQSKTFNASPEPVRRGSAIAVKGRLLVVDWTNNSYRGYGGRIVSVQFRTLTGTYATVKRAKTGADGWVRTTVPAQATGVWRVVYGGNTVAGSAVVVGDAVQVTG
jgi:hypothetical protein